MRALAVLLALQPGAALADLSLLRVESGPRVIAFELSDVAQAKLGLSSDSEPIVEVRLAPSRMEDWKRFTADSAGQTMSPFLCGEPVDEIVAFVPQEDGLVPIYGGDEAEQRRRLSLLKGEATCDTPVS